MARKTLEKGIEKPQNSSQKKKDKVARIVSKVNIVWGSLSALPGDDITPGITGWPEELVKDLLRKGQAEEVFIKD